MPFYSFEMILVGIILLGAMTVGGVKIWLKKRQDSSTISITDNSDEKNFDTL